MSLAIVIFLCILLHPQAHALTPTLTITPTNTLHNVPETLWGVFFEDINHAEEGGLYSELISNRNFGGSDYAPWASIGGALLNLDSSYPLNLYNTKCLHVLTSMEGTAGVSNPGYWGINIKPHTSYTFSFYAIASIDTTVLVQVGNNAVNGNGTATHIYWSQQISLPAVNLTPDEVVLSPLDIAVAPWIQYSYTFTTNNTPDPSSVFYIIMPNATRGQELWLDSVSLQPTEGWNGLSFLRADLAERIYALKPAFMRFPGGGVTEGDRLRDRFEWKKTLGPVEVRPGHYDMWHYWSEDGIGFYEFLLMIEAMDARPIWVVNSGNSRQEQINTQNIYPWIQDALEGLEFAMGDVNTKWGKIRAKLGHPKPFNIYAVGIGNENCEQDFYYTNYGAFHAALRAAYPNLRLIANCDLTTVQPPQPVELWDYHAYNNPDWFIQHRYEFDIYPRGDGSKHIFVSEYAVSSVEAGNGNLIAAIAEATWMMMMERNSDLVDLAAYAPLFVNNNDRAWNPDAIVFNASTSYGTPSYWLQYMFSRAQDGTHKQVVVNSLLTSASNLTQSCTIARVISSSSATHLLIIKLVNWASVSKKLLIEIPTSSSFTVPSSIVEWRTLTSANPTDENSLDQPNLIIPQDTTTSISLSTSSHMYVIPLTLPAYSIHILRVQLNVTQ